MRFGDRLIKLRKKSNMTRSDLAKVLKLTYSAVSKYETDMRKPDQDILIKLADLFNVTTDYLLGRTANPNPPDTCPKDNKIYQVIEDLGQCITSQIYDLQELTDIEKESLSICLHGIKARRNEKNTEKK